MTWDKFARFYDWEFQLFCQEQQKDVKFWQKIVAEQGDPVLELACGSGRITIPLATQGFRITAVDNSEKMLQILRSKVGKLQNVNVIKSEMSDFRSKIRYKFAFVSYSSFQQLLSREEQLRCLKNIHHLLQENCCLGIDIGTHICEGKDQLEHRHLYTAEFPLHNSTVSMFTSYRTDRENMIRYWDDKYLEVFADGSSRIFHNKIALKECQEEYMKQLFQDAGFGIINLYGSFDRDALTKESNNALYIVKKLNP